MWNVTEASLKFQIQKIGPVGDAQKQPKISNLYDRERCICNVFTTLQS